MLTFVLSGGGARGAYQVGALRALFEADYKPAMLVGTSVGALNATFLALHGIDLAGVEALSKVWKEVSELDYISTGRAWLAARVLFRIPDDRYSQRLRNVCIRYGLTPGMKFSELTTVRLIVVATDLNSHSTVLFGASPDDSILDGVLASTAIPPWIAPIENNGRLLTDGGLVSNVPIEPAICQGASEIIALDLADPRGLDPDARGVGALVSKMTATAAARQIHLEEALAEAKGVPVRRIQLRSEQMVPLWDFGHTEQLINYGYQIARSQIELWEDQFATTTSRSWWQALSHHFQLKR